MRKYIELSVLFVIIGVLSFTSPVKSAFAVAYSDVVVLLNDATFVMTGKSQVFEKTTPTRVVQMNLTGASAVSATVELQGSLDSVYWTTISTVNMTTDAASQVWLSSTVPYTAMRANLTAVSGTYGTGGIASAVAAGTNSVVRVMVAQ